MNPVAQTESSKVEFGECKFVFLYLFNVTFFVSFFFSDGGLVRI